MLMGCQYLLRHLGGEEGYVEFNRDWRTELGLLDNLLWKGEKHRGIISHINGTLRLAL